MGKVVASEGGCLPFWSQASPQAWRHNMALHQHQRHKIYAMGRERSVMTAEEPSR